MTRMRIYMQRENILTLIESVLRKEVEMSDQYDLLRLSEDKGIGGVWFGTAKSIQDAVELIRKQAAATKPGKFLVSTHSTPGPSRSIRRHVMK
jgi:hypothetical protein